MENVRTDMVTASKIVVSTRRILHDSNMHFAANHLEARLFDSVTGDMAVELKTYLLAGQRHEAKREEEWIPADWWSAFKERWFPGWALLRWPPRRRCIVRKILVQHVCPHMNYSPREEARHVQWLMQKPMTGD